MTTESLDAADARVEAAKRQARAATEAALAQEALAIVAFAVVMHLTAFKSEPWWKESKGAEVATAALKGLRPVLPEKFGQYLPQSSS